VMLPVTLTQRLGHPGNRFLIILIVERRPVTDRGLSTLNGSKKRPRVEKKGASTVFVPVSGCWSGCTRPPTLPVAFLVCCVAAGSALCACIDRVGLKGSPSTLRRVPQSQRKSRRVERRVGFFMSAVSAPFDTGFRGRFSFGRSKAH
jgi:hypothetical protein